jgi:glycerol transport system ATP-binding protein
MENIAHRYPGAHESDYALKPLQLEWEDGGAYALLGPSGCGKTTLLNIISGLLVPSEGRVLFDGQDFTALAPQHRNIAQVFQFPVVYDTMTVAQNLEFPLKNRGVEVGERKRRVQEVLELLEMTDVASERARNLNADSKQKISLGRGLVRSDANAVLFDEPLTVIDPALKWELRAQLKKVHQSVGHTMIYVTHDQTEALTFADKVLVMREGEVLQIGTPQELFESPAHTFVGRFIGSPGMNVLPCRLRGDCALVGGVNVPLSQTYADHLSNPDQDFAMQLGIRPEHIDLMELAACPEGLSATIQKVDDLGREKIVHLKLADHVVHAIVQEDQPVPVNPVVVFRPDNILLYQHDVLVPPQTSGVAQ